MSHRRSVISRRWFLAAPAASLLSVSRLLAQVPVTGEKTGAGAKPASPGGQGKAMPAAGATAARSPSERALRRRVTAYWKAREALDLRAAYPFYEPEFRKQYTAESYVRSFRRLMRFAPQFGGIESVAIEPSGAKASVRVKLRVKVEMLDGQIVESTPEQKWLLLDGTWWLEGEKLVPNV